MAPFSRANRSGQSRIFAAQRAVCILGVALILSSVSACSKDANGHAKTGDRNKKGVVPITAIAAAQKDVPLEVRAIGKVQAYSTVSIKAQVDGQIMTVHFKEGQEVKKGDLIFTIDPRPFEARLKHAEALLAKEKAQLQTAKKQVERYASVVQKGFVSAEKYDQIISESTALEASVRADESAVESAALELKYCSIRSPINGYVGEIKVDQGNVIKANDNDKPLVIINQISPIYVSFAVPEQNLPTVKKHMASGRLGVLAVVPGEQEHPENGDLTFVDNAVDSATGTIQLKGVFQNQARMLWPGQFVNVILTLATQKGVVVIPSQAVQTGQQGQYVFVVKPDSTAEYRLVTVARALDNEVVIEKGLAPGEKVVTDGHLRLTQGTQLKIMANGEASGEDAPR